MVRFARRLLGSCASLLALAWACTFDVKVFDSVRDSGSDASSGTGGIAGAASGGAAGAPDASAAGSAGAGGGGGSPSCGDSGTDSTAPSCAGMCGTECHGESCCTSILLPGGSFTLGGSVETPTSAATVSSFRLDKYEVTVSRFRRFVEAYPGLRTEGAGAHPLIPGSGWQVAWNLVLPADVNWLKTSLALCSASAWTDEPGPNENRPINCINWLEAFAFCAWDDARLPTEAEWEYAACGGDEQRTYPWGSTWDGARVVYGCAWPCPLDDLSPVGSLPLGAGKWGHLDLAGSLFEWVLDAYAPYPATCVDCANLTTSPGVGGVGVIRGGSWDNQNVDYHRAAHRVQNDQGSMGVAMGIRCVRSP
jgi:formylglycine-generating enzyme required for sulfatase activity